MAPTEYDRLHPGAEGARRNNALDGSGADLPGGSDEDINGRRGHIAGASPAARTPANVVTPPRASGISAELPPCPYCGTAGPLSEASGVGWVVSCIGCPGTLFGRTREGAESAWSARGADDELNRH